MGDYAPGSGSSQVQPSRNGKPSRDLIDEYCSLYPGVAEATWCRLTAEQMRQQIDGALSPAPAAVPPSNADDQLTAEESARKLDILEAIDAIPIGDMPGALKPLAHRLMSHAGYGQGLCWTSYNTLAGETGTSRRQVRRQIADLLSLGWYELAGRHNSGSKHAKPEFKVAQRMVNFIRNQLARLPVRSPKGCPYVRPKVDRTGGNQVDRTGGNKPVLSTGLKNRVDEPERRSGPAADVPDGTGSSAGPPAGEKEDGGTHPVVPPKPVIPAPETREDVDALIARACASGDPPQMIRLKVLAFVRQKCTPELLDFAKEELGKRFATQGVGT